MVTIHDKGSDNVRLRSGSSQVMTKKRSIWVLICKEKREVKVTFVTRNCLLFSMPSKPGITILSHHTTQLTWLLIIEILSISPL